MNLQVETETTSAKDSSKADTRLHGLNGCKLDQMKYIENLHSHGVLAGNIGTALLPAVSVLAASVYILSIFKNISTLYREIKGQGCKYEWQKRRSFDK